MDAGSLTKMTRDRDVIDKIEDHIRKMRIRRPSQDQYTPEEEVEKARNNLGEVINFSSLSKHPHNVSAMICMERRLCLYYKLTYSYPIP